jgi:VanZ family protein
MRLALRLLALAVILGLLATMLGPPTRLPGPEGWTDKVAHVIGFFVIALAIQTATARSDGARAAVAAVAIGAAVELIQGQIGRDASWLDLVADAVGAALAWWASPRLAPLWDWLRDQHLPTSRTF